MFLKIFGFAKPFWRMLLAITVLIVVMAGLNQAEPFITKQITDILVSQHVDRTWTLVFTLLLTLLFVKIIQSILNTVSQLITNLFSVKFEAHLKQVGFDHLMRLSLDFFHDQATGKVMSKLDRGVNRISSIVSNVGIHFLPSITTAVLAFIIVIFHEWKIAVFTLLAFIPYIVINRVRYSKNQILEKKEYKLTDIQYSHFFEVIGSMQLIKAFRAEQLEIKKFTEYFLELLQIRKQIQRKDAKALSGDLLLELFSWGMYAYIVYLTWIGQNSIGTLILLIGLIQLIRQPLWQINWIFWQVKSAQIGAKDFFKILSIAPTVKDPQHPVHLEKIVGEIKFENVSFTYNNQDKHQFDSDIEKGRNLKKPEMENLQVLDEVIFTIPARKTTAFIGPSGAGKTTIASLIMRFFDVDDGNITLDATNIRDLTQFELRSYLGLVSQDAYLFADTIEENLQYAKPDATELQMMAACKAAYADEFIEKLPNKLKTLIGERGIKLSGGQRQRLSLARTILRDPKIIILDEATSALDSVSEMYIQQALKKILTNRTAVVIAHRLSTVQRADNIIVLKDQKVLEQGNHQELMAKDGLYASLFKIQSGDVEKLKEWDLVG
ncbi:MAG: ABC transporter ATP-binding protein [Patescibacteria group bacterium]